MGFKYRKTPEELREALVRKVAQLRRSIVTYDEGHFDEAEQLANTLYTLFAEGGTNTKSLTGTVGIKGSLRFPDSAGPEKATPGTVRIGPPLCAVGQTGYYFPRGAKDDDADDYEYPNVPFSAWWERIVFSTDRGLNLTRKNLVYALGNQDGGRHVDAVIKNEAYHWLGAYGDIHIRDTGNGQFTLFLKPEWMRTGARVVCRAHFNIGTALIATSTEYPPPADAKPIKHAHWATMRQMAWEADQALIAVGF